MLKKLFEKYRSLILYAVFGALTTLINIAVYSLCYNTLRMSNVVSNILAWILAVLFAFLTNKLWVFDSKSFAPKFLFPELWKFTAARLATGAFDLAFMFVAVDLLRGPALLFKVISNVIVIIANYVLSRLLVFRKKD